MATLHLTKVAFGARSIDEVRGWFRACGEDLALTTRHLPRRQAELAGGSLFWILHHTLVGRSPILRFEGAPDGRTRIVLAARLIEVRPAPRRAHQGWRYLVQADAPADLGGADRDDALPPGLAGALARLGLV